MMMTDDAARAIAQRVDLHLRFGAQLRPDDLRDLLADWAEARNAIAHLIALHRQARADLAALEDKAGPRPGPRRIGHGT
jgi:hypothetical protein